MISNVTIKNYKSIVDVSLPLGRFHLLIGANGCGKSNILEGIALGAAAHADKLDYEYFANRGIRIVQPHFMLPAFEGMDAEGIRLSFDNDHVLSYDIYYNKNGKPARWMVEKRTGEDEIPELGQFLIYSLEESKLRKADDSNRDIPHGAPW
jgi:predicted ATPase